jgi:hypothetical protein
MVWGMARRAPEFPVIILLPEDPTYAPSSKNPYPTRSGSFQKESLWSRGSNDLAIAESPCLRGSPSGGHRPQS